MFYAARTSDGVPIVCASRAMKEFVSCPPDYTDPTQLDVHAPPRFIYKIPMAEAR